VNYIARSKFNVDSDVKKRTYNNEIFDSILEMRFYRDWILPKVESGEIAKVDRQVTYELQQKFIHDGKTVLPINYVADFVVQYSNGHTTVFDTKGMPDSVALLKRKMFWWKYPDIDYQWIGYSGLDGGWTSYENIKKGRAKRKKEKLNK
jgi:hypothetical protein